MSDEKRDAAADLAVCDAASPPPWYLQPCGGANRHNEILCVARPTPEQAVEGIPCTRWEQIVGAWAASRGNLDFIALARAALPHWIERAAQAEAEVTRLQVGLYEFGELAKHTIATANQRLAESEAEVARLQGIIAAKDKQLEEYRQQGMDRDLLE